MREAARAETERVKQQKGGGNDQNIDDNDQKDAKVKS